MELPILKSATTDTKERAEQTYLRHEKYCEVPSQPCECLRFNCQIGDGYMRTSSRSDKSIAEGHLSSSRSFSNVLWRQQAVYKYHRQLMAL